MAVMQDQAGMPATPYQSVNAGVIPSEVYGIAINWFVNRHVLATRLPHLPCGSMSFKITNDNFRPFTFLLGESGFDDTETDLTVADTSFFMPGDVIEIENEMCLVTAIASSTVLTITRAYAGTTGASHAQNTTCYLIGNSRAGNEINQAALSRIPVTSTQHLQTFQHPWSVGGALASSTNYVSGYGLPIDRDRYLAMANLMDDLEKTCWYGRGVALAGDTTRPAMYGVRAQLTTNNTTSPTNAGAYKPDDLVRDLFTKCLNGGGQPTHLFVSSEWQAAFTKWGVSCLQIPAGENIFGTPINLFTVSFLPTVNVIFAPFLKPYSAAMLSMPEVRLRVKRELFDKPRGSRGDATEGDMIMEAAIEVDNEAHHAWLSGVTAFAAP